MALLKYTGKTGYDESGILIGKLYQMTDGGTLYYLWQLAEDTYWYISESLGPEYSILGYDLTKKYWLYNSWPYFTFSIYFIWRTGSTWVISRTPGNGVNEWWSGAAYYGSQWYSKVSASIDPSGDYYIRGRFRGSVEGAYSTTETMTRAINGWKAPNANNILGEYAAVGTESGTKTVGWQVLTGDNSLGDLTQKSTESNSEYIFDGDKIAWFDGTDWILSAAVGSKPDTGYWKKTGTNPIGTYDLVYTGETPPTPSSYKLSFKEYTIGTETEVVYLGQVQIWQ